MGDCRLQIDGLPIADGRSTDCRLPIGPTGIGKTIRNLQSVDQQSAIFDPSIRNLQSAICHG
jgi:hypothetical protein